MYLARCWPVCVAILYDNVYVWVSTHPGLHCHHHQHHQWREWDNVSRGHYPAVLHWTSWSSEQLHCHCVVPINEVRAGQPANSEPFLFPLPGKKLRMHKLLYHYNQKTFASLWYLTGSTLITNALLACFTNQKHWHVYASVVLIQIVWGSTYWMHYHACMTAATHLHASTLGRVHVTMPSLLWPRSRLLSFDLLILKICCLSCGTGRPFKVKR